VDLHAVAHRERGADQGAGHDGAEAASGEAAIDGKPRRPAAGRAGLGFPSGGSQGRAQLLDAGTGDGGDGQDRSLSKRRCGQELAHLLGRELAHLLVHRVHFRERHDAPLDAEQITDGHVLPRLRHDAFVRGHHQQHQIDARGPGHHGAHESLVSGHIHHAQARCSGELQGSEAEVDGDAPRLLLGQSVGVDAREHADQGRLAVVDVSGRSQDHGRRVGRGHPDGDRIASKPA
jgi:hypothetical protein